jgi:GntR family histidine utilization transcriptional repressor
MTVPAWQRIHDHVLAKIHAGEWRVGERIPSETELCAQFGVARMTVGRALRELTAAQIVHRVRGAGSFVAPTRYQSTLVEIRNIADEIAARAHCHTAQVLNLEAIKADQEMAAVMELPLGAALFLSRLVHYEDGVPMQFEERWVNPKLAPEYLQQDFTTITPNAYLTKAAPLERVAYSIEARQPDVTTRRLLEMSAHEPCLLLSRRIWSRGTVASAARLWHPGSRHQFTGQL